MTQNDTSKMPDVAQLVGENGEEAGPRARLQIPMWFALGAMAGALVIAVVILARVSGPLYGLLFSSGLPLPDGVEEKEHVKPDKGTEYWVYRTTMSGREVAAFYEEEGGTCRYTSQSAQSGTRPDGVSYSVARCWGQKKSGGLGTSWEVYIAEGYSEKEGPTIFRIYKYSEVN